MSRNRMTTFEDVVIYFADEEGPCPATIHEIGAAIGRRPAAVYQAIKDAPGCFRCCGCRPHTPGKRGRQLWGMVVPKVTIATMCDDRSPVVS